LYSFIVQVDRTQLTLHISSFAYMVYLWSPCLCVVNSSCCNFPSAVCSEHDNLYRCFLCDIKQLQTCGNKV